MKYNHPAPPDPDPPVSRREVAAALSAVRDATDRKLATLTISVAKLGNRLAPKGDLSGREKALIAGIKRRALEVMDEMRAEFRSRQRSAEGEIEQLCQRVTKLEERAATLETGDTGRAIAMRAVTRKPVVR